MLYYPCFFTAGHVKDVLLISTRTSTVQRCFFLLTGHQFKHLHHLHLHGNDNLSNERPYGT